MGKQSTSGLRMAYLEQFVFRILPNSSRISPEELLVTTKFHTNLSCVHSACVLHPGDTQGMTVRWLLQTVP